MDLSIFLHHCLIFLHFPNRSENYLFDLQSINKLAYNLVINSDIGNEL